jgi:hypothetical protein
MKTTGNVLFALGGVILGVIVGACSREIVEKFKKQPEGEQKPEETPKQKKVMVVNVATKDISVVALEPGERVEDETLSVIDVLSGDFQENNRLRSLKAKRNIAKIKEVDLGVDKIADIWFKIKEQETITPEQIAQMVLEACENTGEGK